MHDIKSKLMHAAIDMLSMDFVVIFDKKICLS